MKKIVIIILMFFVLVSCTNNKQEDPIDNPEPINEPEPIEEKEYIYQLEKNWIVYNFELLHNKQTYEIKDGLTFKLVGKQGKADYCQNDPCILYEEVMINDKDIALLENQRIKINSDYGTLTLYNLNDELYLLNFNYAAMYNSSLGIVFTEDGDLVFTYEEMDLTMNEVYQNQFGLSHTYPDGTSTFDAYTVQGKTLEHSKL